MTQEEMVVKLKKVISENQQFTTWTVSTPHIMELIRICVEEEREACAEIAENWRCNGIPRTGVANEIRARNKQ